MSGKIIGYRFGGTEEPHLVPITESENQVESARQHDWIKIHPEATSQHAAQHASQHENLRRAVNMQPKQVHNLQLRPTFTVDKFP